MKKLFTIFLSSIVCVGLWGQQKVPMTIAGDVYIAGSGQMKSVGTVHLKALAPAKVAKVANYGELVLDTVIFYSNDTIDGLLMNKGVAPGLGITANSVIVRKNLKKSNAWYMLSLPFNVNMNTGLKNPLTGQALLRGDHYQVQYYDAPKRVINGTIGDQNWTAYSAGVTTMPRGAGHRIAVKFSLIGGVVGTPMDIDFVTNDAAQITYLFEKQAKGFDLTYASAPPDTWNDNNSEGWNAIGGLNSSRFDIKLNMLSNPNSTTNYSRTYYYTDRNGKWKESTVVDQGTLAPYGVVFVKTDGSTNLTHDAGNPSTSGGFLFYNNGVTLNVINGTEFRSMQANARDIIGLFFTKVNNNDVFDPSNRVLFMFQEGYSKAFKTSEDDIRLDTESAIPIVWALAKKEGSSYNNILAVDCLPLEESEVSLGVNIPDAGEYVFSLKDYYNERVRSAVLLDKLTNTKTELMTNDYYFNANTTTNTEDRFVIYFNKTFTAIDDPQAMEAYAYADNNILIIKNLILGDKIQVIDVSGRTIASGIASGNEFSVNLNQKGVYIVNVKGKKTLKVLNK